MSGWTATECARELRAPTGFESEEDGVGGRMVRVAGAIVGGMPGLLLADQGDVLPRPRRL